MIITCVAWLPLLLLSALAGTTHGDAVTVPFLYDIEAHVRLLVALPVLIAAELVVHLRIRPVITQFVERRIVAPEDMPKFESAPDPPSTRTEPPGVAVHSKVKHDPAGRAIAVVHIFRFKGSSIVELWDIAVEEPQDSPNEHGMF